MLTVGNGNAGGTFSGTIADTTGTIALTKTGTGTQVLAGSSTYTGATTINGGNLAVNGSLSSRQRDRQQPRRAERHRQGGQRDRESLGTVAPGFGGGGTLTASSLSLAASSVLSYTLGSGTATDSRLGITGGLTLSTGLTLTVTLEPVGVTARMFWPPTAR